MNLPSLELTVALPTFNGARHLPETLRSILNQADIPFKLLVCDDRSDDDTLTIVRDLAGDCAEIVINAERLGLAGNWNRCAELARTPFLAIVHQDDILLPGHLASHVSALRRDDAVGMTCGAVEVIDESGKPLPPTVIERPDLGPADRLFPPGTFVAELAATNPVRCSTVVLRTEALASVGGFDPSYIYAVDWECWLRIARQWEVFWIARPTVAIRWHPGSETRRLRQGSADLDEVARLLNQVHAQDVSLLPDPIASRHAANRNLSTAYLNRSLDALHAGNAPLAQSCLRKSLQLHPRTLSRILLSPRLAPQMVALALSPSTATRLFRHSEPKPS